MKTQTCQLSEEGRTGSVCLSSMCGDSLDSEGTVSAGERVIRVRTRPAPACAVLRSKGTEAGEVLAPAGLFKAAPGKVF